MRLRLPASSFVLFGLAVAAGCSSPPIGSPDDGAIVLPSAPGSASGDAGASASSTSTSGGPTSSASSVTGSDGGAPPGLASASDAGGGQFSTLGQSVISTLEGTFGKDKGSVWDWSLGNQLDTHGLLQMPAGPYWGTNVVPFAPTCTPGVDANCDSDFALFTCEAQSDCTHGGSCTALASTVAHDADAPRSLCVGHSDSVLDEIYSELLRAQTRIDITSLAGPDGRYTAAIRNALTRLSTHAQAPLVRVLFGEYPLAPNNAQSVYADLTRDLAAGTSMRLYVGSYEAGETSWNHSKMIAVDGDEAIVGGMNLWTKDYLTFDPVHDMSIHLHGPAAGDAERFADRLWSWLCTESKAVQIESDTHLLGYPGASSTCPAQFGGAEAHAAATSGLPVVTVGRLGSLGDDVGSLAIQTLLDGATSSLRILQQDIGPPRAGALQVSSWPTAYLESIVKAASRGVDVKIILSNLGALPGGLTSPATSYSNGWTAQDVLGEIQAIAVQNPGLWTSSDSLSDGLCARVHVTTLSADPTGHWPDGQTYALHSKLVVSDHRAFYVGSQNMYVDDLAEIGYVVDDPATTAQLESEFIDPAWQYSAAGVSCNALTASP